MRNGSYRPWLAKAWKVSDGGLTYTLDLRGDVTFHDGTKFDAAAVKANLDQFQAPGYDPAVAAIQLKAFGQAEVVASHQLKITLKEPDALTSSPRRTSGRSRRSR
ncbi:ABC transporter substrate-binding protein [Nonomuraea sp. H19]|uniref:ABC transporter substrate-binding protein n=1 Tax=Nonomuraea sp. H19 TaxID=3452206 RepID=UPI003F8AF260